jgi:ribulose-phosphate 3-epimerase
MQRSGDASMRATLMKLNQLGTKDGIVIAPAIMGAPSLEIAKYAEVTAQSGADVLHVDVMDGSFAPFVTFGHETVTQLRSHVSLPIDVHLLVSNPETHLARFVAAAPDILTVHIESLKTPHSTLDAIRGAGIRTGIALKPATPLCAIEEIAQSIDILVVLTVDPGSSKLIPSTIGKIRRARALLDAAGRSDVPIAADGGVKAETIAELASSGARWFVAASAVFGGSGDIRESIRILRTRAQSTLSRS